MRTTSHLIQLANEGQAYRNWYTVAQLEIREGAGLLNVSPIHLANVLSILSPQVSVLRSIRWSLQYVTKGTFAHDITISHKQAMAYYEQTGTIRGMKTRPFASALMGDQQAIVLDGWMAKAMDVDPRKWEVKRAWHKGAARIESVASRLGWYNAEAQAAIWAACVLQHRPTVPSFPVVSEVKQLLER